MWKNGIIGFTSLSGERIEVHYYIKVYDEPSKYGINNWGKISKLELKINGELVAQYDREWVVEPTCEAAKIVSTLLIADYN